VVDVIVFAAPLTVMVPPPVATNPLLAPELMVTPPAKVNVAPVLLVSATPAPPVVVIPAKVSALPVAVPVTVRAVPVVDVIVFAAPVTVRVPPPLATNPLF